MRKMLIVLSCFVFVMQTVATAQAKMPFPRKPILIFLNPDNHGKATVKSFPSVVRILTNYLNQNSITATELENGLQGWAIDRAKANSSPSHRLSFIMNVDDDTELEIVAVVSHYGFEQTLLFDKNRDGVYVAHSLQIDGSDVVYGTQNIWFVEDVNHDKRKEIAMLAEFRGSPYPTLELRLWNWQNQQPSVLLRHGATNANKLTRKKVDGSYEFTFKSGLVKGSWGTEKRYTDIIFWDGQRYIVKETSSPPFTKGT